MGKIKRSKVVLVTGAAGFIGSNLTAKLLKKGYRVRGLDNLSQGDMRNIKEFSARKDFSFIKADVRNASAVLKAARGADFIVHLAAFKIPRYGNAYDTLVINTQGTANCLEAARKTGAKLVFASTSDVYGKNPDLPFQEDGDITLGNSKVKRWAYAVSKLYDEHLCFAYEEKYGVKVCVLRFFGSYGPNQNLTWWGGPQSVFIKAALDNAPIQIHGDGCQTRSFTFVDDTVDGIIRGMESPRSAGEVFNIGNNREIRIKDLAKLIWSMIRPGEKPKLKFIAYRSLPGGNYQDVRKRVPSLAKSCRILGFKPKVALKEGLTRTIAWQKKML